MTNRPLVGLTMGDPAGIGAEVIAGAYPDLYEHADAVVIGDAAVIRDAVDLVDADLAVRALDDIHEANPSPDTLDVLDLANVDELTYGVVREAYGQASLEYIERAIELAREGAIDALTTAPINKRAIRAAGAAHAGHTGLLAARTDTEHYAMLLIEEPLRVSHVSTHVPLREACDRVSTERVLETIRVTASALVDLGIDDPKLAVAGLNPHAGEDGLLGSEDRTDIAPAVALAGEEGHDVVGPEPPDTVFPRAAAGEVDAVVAMYHDQGHIPVKLLGFQSDAVRGVNATIGLPIVRTSVDHGTAFDIAGEGVASVESMVDAVRVATELVRGSAD